MHTGVGKVVKSPCFRGGNEEFKEVYNLASRTKKTFNYLIHNGLKLKPCLSRWQRFGFVIAKMSADNTFLKPPKLVKGWKWLIEWEEFAPGTATKIRVRKTFDLNRACLVREPALREERAQQILEEKKREYFDVTRKKAVLIDALCETNIVAALDVALRVKCATDREHTRITYTSFRNIFCEWLRSCGLENMPVSAMDKAKANAFLDYVLLERRTRYGAAVGNRTYNNYIINLRSLFYELVKREYLSENPFANMKPRKEEQKLRQPFEQADSDAIAAYVFRHNRPVYLAILLISHCGMRLSELRRLRARDIDLQRGLIILGGNQTKNKERAFITIPSIALDFLRGFGLEKIPSGHLVFGLGLKPHPKFPAGRNTISDRFREMLHRMVRDGVIASAQGYTAYSWKDTGALAMVRAGLDIVAIQRHLRHKSLATTQRYLQSLGVVNREVRDFKGVIFKLPVEIVTAA